MTTHRALTVPAAPMTRDQLDKLLRSILRGPNAARARRLVLSAADEYAAHLIEQYARPPEQTWTLQPAREGSQ